MNLQHPSVNGLFIYPIKSCKGISVDHVEFDDYGIIGDRRMMLVDPKGLAITAREFHRLVLVEPIVKNGRLSLKAPAMPEIKKELAAMPETRIQVKIWDDTCEALDCGDDIALWFSKYLKTPSRLVRMGIRFERPVDPKYVIANDHVNFADAYPALLISEASLELLNSKLDTPLPMKRFRPNIVIHNCEAHAEDRWRSFSIGSMLFNGVKLCSRCVFTTVDPDTAEAGAEPLKTLATYRRFEGKVMFGQNVIHHQKSGTIAIGDTIDIHG